MPNIFYQVDLDKTIIPAARKENVLYIDSNGNIYESMLTYIFSPFSPIAGFISKKNFFFKQKFWGYKKDVIEKLVLKLETELNIGEFDIVIY